MLKTFEDPARVREAMNRLTEKRAAGQPKVAQELAAVTGDITRTDDAVKRYQMAFEAGTMQPEDCGPRLQELGIQLRDLHAREAELELAMSDQGVLEITDEWITEIYDEIVETIKTGSPSQKKALAKRLIVQVEIDGKVAYPKYGVPTAGVRNVGTLVDPTAHTRTGTESRSSIVLISLRSTPSLQAPSLRMAAR
jgi:hypothetical protein